MDGFDTLAAAEALEAAGMEPKQAKACAAQMGAVVDARHAELATKADIADLRADFSRLEAATQADISRLEAATKADISRLEAVMQADIASVKAEILKWMFGVAMGQIVLIVTLLKLLP